MVISQKVPAGGVPAKPPEVKSLTFQILCNSYLASRDPGEVCHDGEVCAGIGECHQGREGLHCEHDHFDVLDNGLCSQTALVDVEKVLSCCRKGA